jgi:hypothetical protein
VHPQTTGFFDRIWAPYLLAKFLQLARRKPGYADTDVINNDIKSWTAVGQYLREHPQPPWIIGKAATWSSYDWSESPSPDADRPILSPSRIWVLLGWL